MTRTPLIGITTYHRDDDGIVRLPGEYFDAVRRAGGLPILLPPGESRIDELFELLDGLILSGGGDVDAAQYGGPAHDKIYSVSAERDEFEVALTHQALEQDFPTLCICRGLQVLNVALGGTLITHIPDAMPDSIDHRQPPDQPYGPIPHSIQVQDDSQLAAIMQSGTITPASWHHQSIDQVAKELRVVAHAPDGIIEAVEHPSKRNLIAVQWHPEITAAKDETQQRIFDKLVSTAENS